METNEKLLLELFRCLGEKASYHFADKTHLEWCQGEDSKNKAIQLYEDHPELQWQMSRIAAAFSWKLDICKKIRWYR